MGCLQCKPAERQGCKAEEPFVSINLKKSVFCHAQHTGFFNLYDIPHPPIFFHIFSRQIGGN